MTNIMREVSIKNGNESTDESNRTSCHSSPYRAGMALLDRAGTYHEMESSVRGLACAESREDLRVGGKFLTRMEAKDGSMGFDFGGVYDVVNRHEAIGYAMEDGRRVDIAFVDQGNETKVIETFDAESSNPVEFQQAGWQAILNNFKAYTEQN